MEKKQEERIKQRLYVDRPLSSIDLKEFEKPGPDYHTNLRRLCISLGLISPGESRIAIVKILDLLLKAKKAGSDGMDSYEIVNKLYESGTKLVYANVLRDLRKLMSVGLVEKRHNTYRIRQNMTLKEIIDQYSVPYIINRITDRIVEYAEKIDQELMEERDA